MNLPALAAQIVTAIRAAPDEPPQNLADLVQGMIENELRPASTPINPDNPTCRCDLQLVIEPDGRLVWED